MSNYVKDTHLHYMIAQIRSCFKNSYLLVFIYYILSLSLIKILKEEMKSEILLERCRTSKTLTQSTTTRK